MPSLNKSKSADDPDRRCLAKARRWAVLWEFHICIERMNPGEVDDKRFEVTMPGFYPEEADDPYYGNHIQYGGEEVLGTVSVFIVHSWFFEEDRDDGVNEKFADFLTYEMDEHIVEQWAKWLVYNQEDKVLAALLDLRPPDPSVDYRPNETVPEDYYT